jgi:acyl-CoA thioesterase-2
LHCYFIRPGDPKVPILFKVERGRDGGTFSTRRVIAIQHGKQIFNLAASFQIPEKGFEHQVDMPAAPAADGLLNEQELRRKAGLSGDWGGRAWPVEIRPVDPPHFGAKQPLEPRYSVWFRVTGALADDVPLNQCALAYASDMTLLDTSLRPHAVEWNSGRLQVASLDHALWFHQPSDLTQWHLFVQDSPSASGGRGFNRGDIFSHDGRLVASAAQEALIRFR